ncbi:MAG TPA: hypothetical protein VMW24_20310 [Sedimentisphaerales bacterium]|nr:hypothetical protein [Sedimentisphaerales bacterium]
MRIIRFIIVCTLLGTTPFAIAQEKPNVVTMLADDIGYGDIGIYGGKIPTPNIDWLAQTVNRHNKAEELYNLGNDLSQENNLMDRPEYGQLIDRLHATFIEHNDHDSDTREPRTTKAFRITR